MKINLTLKKKQRRSFEFGVVQLLLMTFASFLGIMEKGAPESPSSGKGGYRMQLLAVVLPLTPVLHSARVNISSYTLKKVSYKLQVNSVTEST